MSDVSWVGGIATAVAQVTTVQITGYDVATTYKITVGSVVISTVGTGGTVNTTATALAAAWNASTHPYCTGVTALASTDTVTFTGDVAGIPFEITSSVTGGTGTIGSATEATASAGPWHLSSAANFLAGAIVANSDSFFVRNNGNPILFGLNQSAITPTLVQIERSYSGVRSQIGLPAHKFATSVSAAGAITYDTTVPEYRTSSMKFGATTWRVGEDIGGGSQSSGCSLIKLDGGTTSATWLIYSTGRPTSGDTLPPLRIKNTNAASVAKVYGQSVVGICYENPADTGQFATIEVYGGRAFIGDGVTLATGDCQAGQTLFKNAPTTIKGERGATYILAGSGTITTLEDRGNLVMQGTYTVTNLKG
jgi:hypothetical protein